MADLFKPVTRKNRKLRICLEGPAGSGKSYTALMVASMMGWKTAAIDTERSSLDIYADTFFMPDGAPFRFNSICPPNHKPENYIAVIKNAEENGYDCLIIDSFTHVWSGKEGFLEMADRESARMQNPNTYVAWRNVTPLYNQLIDAIFGTTMHVIATIRTKVEYAMQTNERGKVSPVKLGMAPIQREGVDYEFDVIGDMTQVEHNLILSKVRHVPGVELDGKVFTLPGKEFVDELRKMAAFSGPDIPKPPAPVVTPPPPKPPTPTPKPEQTEELPFEPDPPKPPVTEPPKRTRKPAPASTPPPPPPPPTPAPEPPGLTSAPTPPVTSGDTLGDAGAIDLVKAAKQLGWNKVLMNGLLKKLGMPESLKDLVPFQVDVVKLEMQKPGVLAEMTRELYDS